MVLYSKSKLVLPYHNDVAWSSVTIRPRQLYTYAHYEEGLAFVFSYLLLEMMATKRSSHSVVVI